MANPLSKIQEEPLEDGRFQFGRSAGMRKLAFVSRDDSNGWVKKIATVDDLRQKLILIQPRETSLYESGLREPGVPGYCIFSLMPARMRFNEYPMQPNWRA